MFYNIQLHTTTYNCTQIAFVGSGRFSPLVNFCNLAEMNTRNKGMRIERKAEQELKADGWLTYRVKGSTKWQRNLDIFGLFDIFAIKKSTIKLIQIKTNQKPNLKSFIEFKKRYGLNNWGACADVEVWVWHGKWKGFEKIVI